METGDYVTVQDLDGLCRFGATGPKKDECSVVHAGRYKIVKLADVAPAPAPEDK